MYIHPVLAWSENKKQQRKQEVCTKWWEVWCIMFVVFSHDGVESERRGVVYLSPITCGYHIPFPRESPLRQLALLSRSSVDLIQHVLGYRVSTGATQCAVALPASNL